ncbi:MAG: hypothetical protein KatS3mg082_1786 [Nitrospiraceae bacterium]|nr:MAG: hypothetical protein KatS3mg082_1786 [Nitrospiraceae bacterium]
MIAFLRLRPELLFEPPAKRASQDIANAPSPRTWARLGQLFALDLPQNLQFPAFAGAVGEAAATEFLAFLRMLQDAPSIDAILLDPHGAPVPDKPHALYAVASGLAHRADPKTFGSIAVYATRLHGAGYSEFAVLAVRDSQRKCPAIANTKDFIKLASGPAGGGHFRSSEGGIMTIKDKAMLVQPSISVWSARRIDKAITREVAQRHGADARKAGRYNKCLIDPEAETFVEVRRIAQAARDFHYGHTLPWTQQGAQILPAAEYWEYSAQMKEFQDRFNQAVKVFVAEYPALKEKARKDLNGLYREEDYPSPTEVKSKFSFEVHILPIPDADDWRVALGAHEEGMPSGPR